MYGDANTQPEQIEIHYGHTTYLPERSRPPQPPHAPYLQESQQPAGHRLSDDTRLYFIKVNALVLASMLIHMITGLVYAYADFARYLPESLQAFAVIALYWSLAFIVSLAIAIFVPRRVEWLKILFFLIFSFIQSALICISLGYFFTVQPFIHLGWVFYPGNVFLYVVFILIQLAAYTKTALFWTGFAVSLASAILTTISLYFSTRNIIFALVVFLGLLYLPLTLYIGLKIVIDLGESGKQDLVLHALLIRALWRP